MKKEYVVSFTDSDQVGPNEFLVVRRNIKVTENTTVAELENFFRKYNSDGITRLEIHELEQLNPQP